MSASQLSTVRAGEQPTRASDAARSGLLLGRYRLQRQLGVGGFGAVHLARDERLGRDVAVKVLPRERVVHARFAREARAAARLQHPAIVTLYEAALDDDGAYLVSELVRGRTLDALLAAGRLSDREIVEVGISLCDALAHAHAEGVVHRDVKPSNVLIPSRPGAAGARAKLTDFGVASVAGSDALTQTGDVVGTAAYMSPEQAHGLDAGPESDLYSLALVLYEALSGVNPVRNVAAARRQRTLAFIPPLRRQRRDVSRPLAAAIDLALSRRADDRGTVSDLRAALAECLEAADGTRGVVGPAWGAGEPEPFEDQSLGPEWGTDGYDEEPARPGRFARRDRFARGGPLAATGATAAPVPLWLPRGLSAGAAGLMTAWLATHLLSASPLAPATVGLLAAAAVLLLPRVGWGVVVAALAVFSAAQGRPGGALALALLALPPMLLLAYVGEGAPLPAGAPVLGLIGLAGAWPAVAARICRNWWQRAVVAAAGYLWLIGVGALRGGSLYWLPAHTPAARSWTESMHVTVERLLLPTLHAGGLGGALVWAAVAVALPPLASRRWPWLSLIVAGASAAFTVACVQALGARTLHDAVLGAVAAGLITAGPALLELGRRAREQRDLTAPVA